MKRWLTELALGRRLQERHREGGWEGRDGRQEGGGRRRRRPGDGRRKEGRRMTGATDSRDHHRFDNSELHLAPLVGHSSVIPDHLVGHPLT